jgi:2-hydroxy-3-keto-5-methylthiopentenyl-1-phosphate phosphatase
MTTVRTGVDEQDGTITDKDSNDYLTDNMGMVSRIECDPDEGQDSADCRATRLGELARTLMRLHRRMSS